ncbi:MAG: MlaD family protein [Acidobacteria bacterium]|nr:MlaD family protein [Acidobacteriota bacterium]
MDDENRLTEVRLGLFVVTALVLFIVGSLWIAGTPFFGTPRISYRIVMKESGGVKAGDRVRFAGVEVGRIQRVTLDPDQEWPVVFHVSLQSDIPVRIDSSAKIATTGLLGSKYLQVEPGSPTEDLLPPGGEIQGRSILGMTETLARLDEISEKAVVLLSQTTDILDRVSTEMGPILSSVEMLLSEENVENVGHMLYTLHETVQDAAPRVSLLIARLESISGQIEGGLEGMPEVSAKVSTLLDDLHGAFGPEGSRLAEVLEAAESSLSSADQTLSILGENRKEVEAALRDMRDTIANLKAFSQLVKERPFSLVRIKGEPERLPGQGVTDGAP